MNFYEHEIIVGANKPFQFLHMTDTHLTYADFRDDQRKTDLAQHRKNLFRVNLIALDNSYYLIASL